MEWLTQWHPGEMMRDMVTFAILAHLIRTIPPVENKWAAWIIGGAQFIFANIEQFRSAKKEPKQ